MTTQSTTTHNSTVDKASAMKLDTMQLSQLLANDGALSQPALKKNGSHVKRKTDEELLADANSELKLSGEAVQEQPIHLAQAETPGAASAATASSAGGIDAILASAGVGTGTAIAGAAAVGLAVGIVASSSNPAPAPVPATSNAPLLVASRPVDNSNSFANGDPIVLTFNKAVQAGTGNIVITGGTDVRIIPVGDKGQVTFSGNTVTINSPPDLLSDRMYFVTIESGVITDTAAGTPNAFKGITDITALNFFTGPAPTLVSATPADNATAVPVGNNAVPVGNNIVLTFSEKVVAGVGDIVITNANNPADTRTITVTKGTNNTFPLAGNAVLITDPDGTVTFSGNTVTIDPTNLLSSNGVYNVTMASGVIKDVAGNPYAGILNATTLNFNTTSTVAPILVSSSPVDGGVSVAVSSNIVLTFSDAVIAGTGDIVITNANTLADTRTITLGGVDPDGTVTFSGNTVTINPAVNLVNGASYNVQIASTAIKSTSGLDFAGIANPTTLNFIITTNPPPIVTDVNINITSIGAGVLTGETTEQVYIVGNTITATWNNSAGGNNNADVTGLNGSGVVMDFSEFNSGAPALVNATLSVGIWTASYTISNITANSLNNRNVAVIVTDTVGNVTTLRNGVNGVNAVNLSVQDTTSPVITINTIMGDNILNFLEANTRNLPPPSPPPDVQNPGNAGQAWSISGTTDVDLVGRTVTIIINDGVHPAIGGTAKVQADGSWKVLADTTEFPSNSLFEIRAAESASMTVGAWILDEAGNGVESTAIIIIDFAAPSVMGGIFTTGANASVTMKFNETMSVPTTDGLTILKNGTELVTTGILFGGTTTNLTIATETSLVANDFLKISYVDATGNWGDAAGNQVADSQWFIGGSGNNTIDVHFLNGNVTVSLAATVYGNAGDDTIIGSNTTANAGVNPLGDFIFGGFGNDTITGGAGGDTLSGGLGGADIFIFNRGDAVAIVGGDGGDFRFTALGPNGVDALVERIVDLDILDTITLTGGLTLAVGFDNIDGLTAENTFALIRGTNVADRLFRVDAAGVDTMLFYDNNSIAGVQLAAVLLDGAGGMNFNVVGGVITIV